MENKKLLNSPFSPNGQPVPTCVFDDHDYLSLKILDKVVKTGDGDQDFIIEKTLEIDRTPIKDVVDTDKEACGVYNVLKLFQKTGDDSLLPRDDGKNSGDFLNAPTSLMEIDNLGKAAEQKFKTLPKGLVKGADMKSFVENMTNEQFEAFVKAVADRSSGKTTEVKKDGE